MVSKYRAMLASLTVFVLAFGLIGVVGCAEEVVDEAPEVEETELAEEASGLDAFAGLEGAIDIAGGTAHIPVMEAAAADVMRAHDDIVITVAGGGSGVGIQQVGEGLVDIGNSGREPKDEEFEQYPDLELFAFAIDGVTVIVHPENPVRDLSTEQVQGIFAGEITDWSEVGSGAGAINVYAREDGSGTGETFIDRGLQGGDVTAEAIIVTSNGAMKTAVAADEQAIGFMSIGSMDDSVAGVAYNGVEPTNESALDGSFVVTRRLYSITNGEPDGLTKAFLDYIMGADGVSYIEDAGYIPTYTP